MTSFPYEMRRLGHRQHTDSGATMGRQQEGGHRKAQERGLSRNQISLSMFDFGFVIIRK
jgi:hypothetical protein